MVATSPIEGLARPSKPVDRDRVLDDKELKAIYRAASFMSRRIRTAMTPKGGKLGDEGKVLDPDETFIGGKAKTLHKQDPPQARTSTRMSRSRRSMPCTRL